MARESRLSDLEAAVGETRLKYYVARWYYLYDRSIPWIARTLNRSNALIHRWLHDARDEKLVDVIRDEREPSLKYVFRRPDIVAVEDDLRMALALKNCFVAGVKGSGLDSSSFVEPHRAVGLGGAWYVNAVFRERMAIGVSGGPDVAAIVRSLGECRGASEARVWAFPSTAQHLGARGRLFASELLAREMASTIGAATATAVRVDTEVSVARMREWAIRRTEEVTGIGRPPGRRPYNVLGLFEIELFRRDAFEGVRADVAIRRVRERPGDYTLLECYAAQEPRNFRLFLEHGVVGAIGLRAFDSRGRVVGAHGDAAGLDSDELQAVVRARRPGEFYVGVASSEACWPAALAAARGDLIDCLVVSETTGRALRTHAAGEAPLPAATARSSSRGKARPGR